MAKKNSSKVVEPKTSDLQAIAMRLHGEVKNARFVALRTAADTSIHAAVDAMAGGIEDEDAVRMMVETALMHCEAAAQLLHMHMALDAGELIEAPRKAVRS